MKKIGIVTLNGNFNIGNRLQNYALKKYLESLKLDVETIWFCRIKDRFIMIIKNIIFNFLISSRGHNFRKFSKSYLNTKYFASTNVSNRYDYIIVGSDQVWNYNFPGFSKTMFLDFSPYEKNIAYSASFGIDRIPTKYNNMYKNGLNNIKSLSVREDAGKKIVNDIVGRKDVEVLVDPTMLLDKKEWDRVAKKPKKLNDSKYILLYFLGNISKKRMDVINKYAKENNYEIINILDKESKFYSCGPAEFLYLEKHAELICTDSYHASVFSIIYDRPFIIYDRDEKNHGNMGSRIDTLLSKLKINDRRYNGKSITSKNLKHDYKKAYEVLKLEREKSKKYLKKSMNLK